MEDLIELLYLSLVGFGIGFIARSLYAYYLNRPPLIKVYVVISGLSHKTTSKGMWRADYELQISVLNRSYQKAYHFAIHDFTAWNGLSIYEQHEILAAEPVAVQRPFQIRLTAWRLAETTGANQSMSPLMMLSKLKKSFVMTCSFQLENGREVTRRIHGKIKLADIRD